jgi:hypothetical protein
VVLQTAQVGFDSHTGYWRKREVVIAPGSALGLQNRRPVLRGSIPPPPAGDYGSEAQIVEQPVVNGKDAGATPVGAAAQEGKLEVCPTLARGLSLKQVYVGSIPTASTSVKREKGKVQS